MYFLLFLQNIFKIFCPQLASLLLLQQQEEGNIVIRAKVLAPNKVNL
jgi:hypothetical protein